VEGPPGKGEGKGNEARGGEEWEGKEKGYPPNENPGYGLVRYQDVSLVATS